MKKVNANWLQKRSEASYRTLDDLMECYEFVGFTDGDERYMISSVDGTSYAVRPSYFYASDQSKAEGKYFIFDTKEELLTWMMN